MPGILDRSPSYLEKGMGLMRSAAGTYAAQRPRREPYEPEKTAGGALLSTATMAGSGGLVGKAIGGTVGGMSAGPFGALAGGVVGLAAYLLS